MGGLSVLRHFLDLFPREQFLYLGDMARFPYGSKSRETIRRFALEDAGFLMEFRPGTLVAACFTVSSQALEDLVGHCAPVRVVGMVEAGAVAALSVTRTGRIGVLGTEGTVQSGAYPAVLKRLSGRDTDVLSVACPLFAPMVEEGWIDGDIPERIVRTYLSPFLSPESGIDTIILGCTHYPPLLPLFRKVLPEVVFIDPGRELAQAERALRGGESKSRAGGVTYLVTDGRTRFQNVGQRLLGQSIPEVHEVTIPSGDFIFSEKTGRIL
jgi:glutamate racemase